MPNILSPSLRTFVRSYRCAGVCVCINCKRLCWNIVRRGRQFKTTQKEDLTSHEKTHPVPPGNATFNWSPQHSRSDGNCCHKTSPQAKNSRFCWFGVSKKKKTVCFWKKSWVKTAQSSLNDSRWVSLYAHHFSEVVISLNLVVTHGVSSREGSLPSTLHPLQQGFSCGSLGWGLVELQSIVWRPGH